jgi:hypothetical protein
MPGRIMKKTILISCLLLTGFFAIGQKEKSYQLVWSDEFDQEGPPDSANWDFEKGFVRNQEFQWYQPENANCSNGMLTIEAKKEEKPNPQYTSESKDWRRNRQQIQYTSACLITRGRRTWGCLSIPW